VTVLSFLEYELVDMDFLCLVLAAQDLEEAEVDFQQSLVMCLEMPQKRQSLLLRHH